jgi:hypothetical protein
MKPILVREQFSIREVCHVLDVSESTLRRMIAAGDFPEADLPRGGKSYWSFRIVAGEVRMKIFAEQQRINEEGRALAKLDDHLEDVEEKILGRSRVGIGTRARKVAPRHPWYVRLISWWRNRR